MPEFNPADAEGQDIPDASDPGRVERYTDRQAERITFQTVWLAAKSL